jgi:hypothetical protein
MADADRIYWELLRAAIADNRRRGIVSVPASEERLLRLREVFQEQFGVQAPDQYLEFLRITDGLEFNGLSIFSSHCSPSENDPQQPSLEGFEYGNLWLRVAPYCDRLLYFGIDSITLYAMETDTGCFKALSPSLDTIRLHSSFDEMIAWALFDALDRQPDLRPPGGQPNW